MAEADGVRVHARGEQVIGDRPQLVAQGVLVFPRGRSLPFDEVERVDLLFIP